LLGNTHQYHKRTARRELRFPPILAGLELAGWFSRGRAFGMRRRLLHRLHGSEQDDGEGEDFQEFHKMISDELRLEQKACASPIRLSSHAIGRGRPSAASIRLFDRSKWRLIGRRRSIFELQNLRRHTQPDGCLGAVEKCARIDRRFLHQTFV
jgi:hypothetical protein